MALIGPIKTFAVDFDGTAVAFDFPRVGAEIGAAPVLRELVANGHRIILFTMRSDKKAPSSTDPDIVCPEGSKNDYLTQAVAWFARHNIPLYGINTNPTQSTWTDSPKCYADYIIDDTAFGVPTILDPSVSPRAFVDWDYIRMALESRQLI